MRFNRVSDQVLSDLRCASLLAWMVPSVRFRVLGPEVLMEVARPPLPTCGDNPVLPTCLFYAAVARAHARRRSGVGSGTGGGLGRHRDDLIVELAVTGGEVLASGVVRIGCGGRLSSAAAVALPAAACLAAIEDGSLLTADVVLHGDTALDATLLTVDCPAGDPGAAAVAADTLEAALARCLVAELTGHLTADAPDHLGQRAGL